MATCVLGVLRAATSVAGPNRLRDLPESLLVRSYGHGTMVPYRPIEMRGEAKSRGD